MSLGSTTAPGSSNCAGVARVLRASRTVISVSTIVNDRSALVGVRIRSVRGVAGRRIAVDQLVGASEIAKRLGVTRPQVVHVWRQRYPEFPAPVATLEMGMVWNWPDVERWARATGRLP